MIPIEMNSVQGGLQMIYKFDNGYGASVIQHEGSYGSHKGKWELAVLCHGALCYDTHITDDVLGHLTWSEVDEKLNEINRLHLTQTMV